MRLLFLAVLRRHTGNAVTAQRVRDHLEAAGHVCILKDAFDFESPSEISSFIKAENLEAAVALHLYRGGRLLQGNGIPFGIIFGGTDLNEDVNQGDKNKVMGKVLEEASSEINDMSDKLIPVDPPDSWNIILCTFDENPPKNLILPCCLKYAVAPTDASSWVSNEQDVMVGTITFAVAFTESMKETAQRQWELQQCRTPPLTGILFFSVQRYVFRHQVSDLVFEFSEINQSADNLHVFLLICGLRQVKDPLYLVDAFSEWHQEEANVYMVIVGPEVDPVFTREVKAKVKRSPGVRLIREMAQEDLHAVMKNCFALVNSSVSEGMSAAILEAMDLEVPVLARNIPGNAAVVKHEVTGLLFSDPQEFVQLAKRLVSDPALEKKIVANGKEYVRKYHSWQEERQTYRQLVRTLERSTED
ncbi:hypothetical protein MJT46_013954 [Ovis ammon polii x Ovis aries]|nr:hypothetical protein MJT46_013954 [Ovis ammon polii x Ovis aries]